MAGRSEPNTFTAPGEKESFIPLLTGSGVHCSRFSFFSAFVIALGAAAAAAGLLLLLLVMENCSCCWCSCCLCRFGQGTGYICDLWLLLLAGADRHCGCHGCCWPPTGCGCFYSICAHCCWTRTAATSYPPFLLYICPSCCCYWGLARARGLDPSLSSHHPMFGGGEGKVRLDVIKKTLQILFCIL